MDAKAFGAFIAERRKELGMTQSDLAAQLSVTDKAVSRWERGLGFPDISTLEPLAAALGVSVEELLRAKEYEFLTEVNPSGDMLIDVLKLASVQRDEERNAIWRIGIVVTLAVAVLFLIDTMSWFGFFGVWLPMWCLFAGIAFVAYGMWLRGRGVPAGKPLLYGGLLLLVPVALIVFFFAVGALGIGPVAS